MHKINYLKFQIKITITKYKNTLVNKLNSRERNGKKITNTQNRNLFFCVCNDGFS